VWGVGATLGWKNEIVQEAELIITGENLLIVKVSSVVHSIKV
jgi:hypothetical protein